MDRMTQRGRLSHAVRYAPPIFAAEAKRRRRQLETAARRDPAFWERLGYSPRPDEWLTARSSVARLLAERFRADLERLGATVLGLSDAQLARAVTSLETMGAAEMVDRVLAGDLSFVAPLGRAPVDRSP